MEKYLSQIIGKTISSVIIRTRKKGKPRCQLFLNFEDGNSYEFFCNEELITPTASLWHKDAFTNIPIGFEDLIRVGHPSKQENMRIDPRPL